MAEAKRKAQQETGTVARGNGRELCYGDRTHIKYSQILHGQLIPPLTKV